MKKIRGVLPLGRCTKKTACAPRSQVTGEARTTLTLGWRYWASRTEKRHKGGERKGYEHTVRCLGQWWAKMAPKTSSTQEEWCEQKSMLKCNPSQYPPKSNLEERDGRKRYLGAHASACKQQWSSAQRGAEEA